MKQTKQANKFTFNWETKEVKKNGRKFGEIIASTDKQIDVLITTKQHAGTGEIMIFHIVPNEDKD
jgi:hypothetical protein